MFFLTYCFFYFIIRYFFKKNRLCDFLNFFSIKLFQSHKPSHKFYSLTWIDLFFIAQVTCISCYIRLTRARSFYLFLSNYICLKIFFWFIVVNFLFSIFIIISNFLSSDENKTILLNLMRAITQSFICFFISLKHICNIQTLFFTKKKKKIETCGVVQISSLNTKTYSERI